MEEHAATKKNEMLLLVRMLVDGAEITASIGSFSHCCSPISDKKQLSGGRIYFSLLFEGTVYHDSDDVATGA